GTAGASTFMMPDPTDYASIPQDPKNPITEEKVFLGKLLFHEPGLAINPKDSTQMYTYSCASCHHVDAGFQAGRQQGIGEGGWGFGWQGEGRYPAPGYNPDSMDVQPIRSPSALNVAYQELMLWNGQFGATGQNSETDAYWTPGTPKEVNNLGFQGVETQAIAGLAVHRMDYSTDMPFYGRYKPWFDSAFPGVPEGERYTRVNAGLAIAAYERTLLASEAPFQRYLRGQPFAMTLQQKRGARLFFGEAGCVQCHTGPALSSMTFSALGMNDLVGVGIFGPGADDPAHLGRGGFTQEPDELYQFKVPQLYNLKDSPFMGHGGSFQSVEEIVRYKNNAVAENDRVPAQYLDSRFVPLRLRDHEIEDITAFIEEALHDAELNRYAPTQVLSGFCFPNNDTLSREQMGCGQ
ncbi:MAG: cytochrome c peroxidase, partial [Bacteroidota bacterium]